MKRLIILLLLLYAIGTRAQTYSDSVLSPMIKTVTFYRSGIDQEPAVLRLGAGDHAVLDFDLLSDEPATFRYTLRHCDATWHPDDLEPYEYLTGLDPTPIDNYEQSFTTLQPYYHYRATIPSTGTTILLSGNYLVALHPDDNPDSTLLICRLRVSEEVVSSQMQISRPTSGVRLMQDQEVNVAIEPRANLDFGTYEPFQFTPTYIMPFLQQNGRLDNVQQLDFQGYGGTTLHYRWKETNIFAGGNSFRYFDISNLNSTMYNLQSVEHYGGETFAIIRPDEDRSERHYEARETLNGGMKVNIWDRSSPNTEADYAWVNLSLPMARPMLNGTLHVVGALTQWHLDDMSQMQWRPEYKAYTLRLYLKQGYYSYQLLFLPTGEHQALTATIEGDHNETHNNYTLYIYYRTPTDRYDRLLGINQIK